MKVELIRSADQPAVGVFLRGIGPGDNFSFGMRCVFGR